MDTLLRFGYGVRSYVFDPEQQASIQPEFGDNLAQSERTIGMSGGIYIYGADAPPAGIGNVQAFFWIIADSNEEMEAERLLFMQMKHWGPKQLIKRLTNGTQVWTWGVVTNVRPLQVNASSLPHKYLQMEINFHCPKAVWYGAGVPLVDNATLVQNGLPLTAPKIDRQSVGNGDTVTVTNNGIAPAGVYIRWEAPTGVTITNPKLTRDNEAGIEVDHVQYTDTLNPNDVVDIDCRNHLLYDNYVVTPNYGKLDVKHGEWLRLEPGANVLDVSGTFSGGDGLLTIDAWDVY